ncbi:EamA family transporter [Arthrobacter silvisoli]|uniref:EamA family transporter n=1 Tax=Arthrobacter silvisoli TaxID=2291022 RepID=UPI001B34DF92|nr:EamA family transporter [Arthrobacter silvisoli]
MENAASNGGKNGTARGVATLMASSLSNQLGAASGSLAFPAIGPLGVVAVRQLIAAAVLLPIARPRFRSFTRGQLWPVLLLAMVFGTMNLGLYSAIDRIGLGLAVTLEFLGPLSIALVGSRSRAGAACALAAAAGVVAITQPGPSTDYPGIGLGLMGAASWAAYILLNRTIGQRIPGIQGTAAAMAVSAACFLPVACLILLSRPVDWFSILCAVGAGVLASVVPYIADLLALRRVPASLFGILMSVNPVFAALIGLAMGQALDALQWAGILLIVAANASVLRLSR